MNAYFMEDIDYFPSNFYIHSLDQHQNNDHKRRQYSEEPTNNFPSKQKGSENYGNLG